MVDNTELNAGTGGDTIGSDDITGIKYQRIKLIHGADGTNDGDVSSVNGLPVELLASTASIGVVDLGATDNAVLDAIAAAQLPDGHNVTVDNASVAVTAASLPLPAGAATAAAQLADGHSVALSAVDNAVLDTIDTALDAINAKLVTGTVIGDVNLGATDNAVLDSIVSGQLADGHSVALSATDNAVLDDIAAKLAPHATNGHSFYLNQDTSAVASVKASAGTIYWIACMSIDATPVYLNLYNVASGSVTLGTTTPSMQFIVPSQGDANGAGFTINFGPLGIQFGTAITVACATTFGGSTDPGTNVVITNIGYE